LPFPLGKGSKAALEGAPREQEGASREQEGAATEQKFWLLVLEVAQHKEA